MALKRSWKTPMRWMILAGGVVALAGCEGAFGGAGSNVSVTGEGTVGVGSGGVPLSNNYYTGAWGGPPSGRTPAERQARKDYYMGPRGSEF